MIINLYRYRDYIWRNALSQLRQRYAGSGLGLLWFIVYPLAQIRRPQSQRGPFS